MNIFPWSSRVHYNQVWLYNKTRFLIFCWKSKTSPSHMKLALFWVNAYLRQHVCRVSFFIRRIFAKFDFFKSECFPDLWLEWRKFYCYQTGHCWFACFLAHWFYFNFLNYFLSLVLNIVNYIPPSTSITLQITRNFCLKKQFSHFCQMTSLAQFLLQL
jgi:hypothetical protein